MSIGQYLHVVRVQAPNGVTPDTDGGFTPLYVDVAARWHCRIAPAAAKSVERQAAGTTIAEPTSTMTGHYIAGVVVGSRVLFGARTFNVVGVRNVDERSVVLELSVVEVA